MALRIALLDHTTSSSGLICNYRCNWKIKSCDFFAKFLQVKLPSVQDVCFRIFSPWFESLKYWSSNSIQKMAPWGKSEKNHFQPILLLVWLTSTVKAFNQMCRRFFSCPLPQNIRNFCWRGEFKISEIMSKVPVWGLAFFLPTYCTLTKFTQEGMKLLK